MEKIISCCGIICSECEAFLATKFDDDEARTKVAETWSKAYNAELAFQDINCKGCLSAEEPLFSHCRVCEIRKCVMDKGLLNCAHCDIYPCETISQFFEMAPGTKDVLDEIKQSL